MPVGGVQTRVVYAVNFKKESGGAAREPFQIIESIIPGVIFRGNIIVEEPLSDRVIKNPIKLEDLLQSSHEFYSKEHKREHSEMKLAGVSVSDDFFSKGNIPIRLGRHSGAEAVTIDGHRQIKIIAKKRENTRIDYQATTLWLASEESKPQSVTNLRAFGWGELCEITTAVEKDIEKREKDWTEGKSDRKKSFFIQDSIAENSSVTQPPSPSAKKAPESEIWENVILLFSPGTGTVMTRWENKNASTKDKSIIPTPMLELLKKKKKANAAKVKAELIGGKEYRIVEICI